VTGGPRLLSELLERETSRRQLAKPAAAVVLAFALGAGLLGLAGWFIAASATAGLTVASTFSFLYPSAEVQALAWARTAARYLERISTHQATVDLVGALRVNLFARALGLPRDRVAELRSSELVGRITVDSDTVENLLLRAGFPVVAGLAALIGTAAFLAPMSAALVTTGVGGLLLTSCVLVALGHRHGREPSQRLVDARADARQHLIETLDGLPELRSFGVQQQAIAGAAGQLQRLSSNRRQIATLTASVHNLGILLADLTLLVLIVVAAGLTGARELSAPEFVAVCLVVIAASEPVLGLPAAVISLARARAASARLAEVFPENAVGSSAVRDDSKVPAGVLDALELGSTVLITGPSGSGKTTILRGIAAQRPADVTFVAQDAHVFDATIRENLALADPTADEPALWRALAAAALDDTVAGFPSGLETPAGPDGDALSGGQRRRLSVAQGLLRHSTSPPRAWTPLPPVDSWRACATTTARPHL